MLGLSLSKTTWDSGVIFGVSELSFTNFSLMASPHSEAPQKLMYCPLSLFIILHILSLIRATQLKGSILRCLPAALKDSVPAVWREIVSKMLVRDPYERATADELMEMLSVYPLKSYVCSLCSIHTDNMWIRTRQSSE